MYIENGNANRSSQPRQSDAARLLSTENHYFRIYLTKMRYIILWPTLLTDIGHTTPLC